MARGQGRPEQRMRDAGCELAREAVLQWVPSHIAVRGILCPMRFIPRRNAPPAPPTESLRMWDTLTCGRAR